MGHPDSLMVVRGADGVDRDYLPLHVYERVIAALERAIDSWRDNCQCRKDDAK